MVNSVSAAFVASLTRGSASNETGTMTLSKPRPKQTRNAPAAFAVMSGTPRVTRATRVGECAMGLGRINEKGLPGCLEALLKMLVAGAGFEPATFGL